MDNQCTGTIWKREFQLKKGTSFQNLTHLCIIANKSSVVRILLGDVRIMSSSTLVSSVKGESELSLGVESAAHNIPITSLDCLAIYFLDKHTINNALDL